MQLEDLKERKAAVDKYRSVPTPSAKQLKTTDKDMDSLFDQFSSLNLDLTASQRDEIEVEGDNVCPKLTTVAMFLEGSYRQFTQVVPSYLQHTAEMTREVRQEMSTLAEIVNRTNSMLGQPGALFKDQAGPTVWSPVGLLSNCIGTMETKMHDAVSSLSKAPFFS